MTNTRGSGNPQQFPRLVQDVRLSRSAIRPHAEPSCAVSQLIPPPPPVPAELRPSTPVVVSAAQLWSSAIQNIIISGIVGGLMYTKTVNAELGLIILAAISGIDLLGRLKAKVSPTIAAAIGATGLLSGRFPHFVVLLAVLSTLVTGCGMLPGASPQDALSVVRASLDQVAYVCTLPVAKESYMPEVCEKVSEAVRVMPPAK